MMQITGLLVLEESVFHGLFIQCCLLIVKARWSSGTALDFRSGGPWFKSGSDRYLESVSRQTRVQLRVWATYVNSQLVFLLPSGIFSLLCLI